MEKKKNRDNKTKYIYIVIDVIYILQQLIKIPKQTRESKI